MCKSILKLLKDFTFYFKSLKTSECFYIYSTSQFEPAVFQVPKSHMSSWYSVRQHSIVFFAHQQTESMEEFTDLTS